MKFFMLRLVLMMMSCSSGLLWLMKRLMHELGATLYIPGSLMLMTIWKRENTRNLREALQHMPDP
jgi:hypothetical protein